MPTLRSLRRTAVSAAALCLCTSVMAQTKLADRPIFNSVNVPGNLALTVSVEFPTAISVAHPTRTYSSANTYIGYFDPDKCYDYQWTSDTDDGKPAVYTPGTSDDNYFYPVGKATARTCSSKWSGNFLNWATMQTIDPFRWALTGGYRSIDTDNLTVLEKAWSGNQGGDSNFPISYLNNATALSQATPFSSSTFAMSVRTRGNRMRFVVGGPSANDFSGSLTGPFKTPAGVENGKIYDLFVRVRVCDKSAAAGGLESNCVKYPSGEYKPEGLMQSYKDRMRYSVFGYLNDSNLSRDGGVLRARQKFIGPTMPVPGSVDTTNTAAEWSATTGVMLTNPNASEASDTSTTFGVTVSNSGVMNYLNKFGQITPGNYKTYDPVGELYYAATRYFRNLGNVPAWTNMSAASAATKTTYIDGFPVITDWKDPIQYSCQKNFILGIGDVNTHADRNLPGATGSSEPTKPAEVSADNSIIAGSGSITMDSVAFTNKVGLLHGLGSSLGATQNYGGCCNNNGALMAGLAYLMNTGDIRADMTERQSIQTYWLDVLEYGTFKANNQFYLAAKYGGFSVPDNFDPVARATDIDQGWWYTTTDTVPSGAKRPDNYFTAARADQMVTGLTKAFASIASKAGATSSAFSTALPQVALTGTSSFATNYKADTWTGELEASEVTYDKDSGAPSLASKWKFSAVLATQASGTGWSTKRNIASYDPVAKKGVAFTAVGLPAALYDKLDTPYIAGDDKSRYLNYLRGDRKDETTSTDSGSAKAYRTRASLVGDIVQSRPRPVSQPTFPYGDAANPGYSKFRTDYKSRPTMVYVGTNQGMVHAVNGSLTGTDAGKEVFAYVPSSLFSGPSGDPTKDGLASLGNPDFTHYNQVDAPPMNADVDFGKTVGGSGTDWRSMLIGGLGKGGRSYYALDITNPLGVTSEAEAVKRVLWEFTDTKMGYSYGEPVVVKTAKYGWVVFLPSGHNNPGGKGHVFIVNPRTGELLETISTPEGSDAKPAGVSALQAFVPDVTDGTADALYFGDLLGNLWRVDLTKSSGAYSAPVKLAELTDVKGDPLPVTAKPLVVVQPGTLRRWVTIGTGKLLSDTDLADKQKQRFYAIVDGVNAKFWNESDLPSGFDYPIKDEDLTKRDDLTKKLTQDYTKKLGWYLDLGESAVGGGDGWRVISDSSSYNGIVAFSTMKPTSDNVCAPSGSSRLYALDLGTGSSRLMEAGKPKGYVENLSGVIVDLGFRSVVGKPRLYFGDNSGKRGTPEADLSNANAPRRLNWREIPRSR